MTNVKIRGLPKMDEESLNKLFDSIKRMIINISKTKINEKDVIIDCLSSSESSKRYEVTIEITGLFVEKIQTPEIHQKLLKKVEEILCEALPDHNVKCSDLVPNDKVD